MWLEAGRDPTEVATAMNMLTILLCRDEYYKEALLAARAAVAAMPNEPLLWQILISLSDTPAVTVKEARRACPDDPELWLAELVVKTHTQNNTNNNSHIDKKWLTETVTEAIEKKFPPAALTRAGEYLRRNNMADAAIPLARDVTERSRGLLPAYIFAMHCALSEKDEKWALECTKKAIESSLRPLPEFYENLVNLKTSDGKIDTESDMVDALRNLRKTDPDNQAWAQMLGYIRFKRGGWEIVDAMSQMQAAINNGATNSVPYLIASEASRLLRNYDRAADILRQGLKHNPNSAILINNLAFTLSYSPKNIDEAVSMIPQLLQLSKDNTQIKDTIATIYLRKGNLDASQKIISSILKTSDPGSPAWFKAKIHLAEIASLRGQKNEAVAILTGILKNLNGISDEDVMTANALLSQINNPKVKSAIEE
jgi:tetratricopeptide (TPR) repeat protein